MTDDTTFSHRAETEPRLHARHWFALFGIALTVILIDQGIKSWVLTTLALGQGWPPEGPVLGIFAITYSQNTGIAFGLLPQAGGLFLAISIVVSAMILYWYWAAAGQMGWPERLALGLVLGGALSNVLDRMRYGYVVDFFHVRIEPIISNVSNTADHAIVAGVFILLAVTWWKERQVAQPEAEA